MRPLSGVIQGDGSVLCENGLVVEGNIPKGLRRHDPVLVFYDFHHGRVVNITLEQESEVDEDLNCTVEVPAEPSADGELDDIVETDGTGDWGSPDCFLEGLESSG